LVDHERDHLRIRHAAEQGLYHFYVNKPSSCSNRYSIEAVATHEFGHAFGLAHVSETYHPSLTMSTVIRSCQASESTLGLGDVRGLNALY
jgi:predicted Zn-dependent protease